MRSAGPVRRAKGGGESGRFLRARVVAQFRLSRRWEDTNQTFEFRRKNAHKLDADFVEVAVPGFLTSQRLAQKKHVEGTHRQVDIQLQKNRHLDLLFGEDAHPVLREVLGLGYAVFKRIRRSGGKNRVRHPQIARIALKAPLVKPLTATRVPASWCRVFFHGACAPVRPPLFRGANVRLSLANARTRLPSGREASDEPRFLAGRRDPATFPPSRKQGQA